MQRKSINLFNDKEVRCYKTVFNITDEEDLHEWWEYNLGELIHSNQDSIEFIHMLYRSCYRIIETYMLEFDIWHEKKSNVEYWTIWANVELSMLEMSCIEFKNTECKIDGKLLTFKVTNTNTEKELVCPMPILEINQKQLVVYDFLSKEDMQYIVEVNSELDNQLVYLSGKGFCEKSMDRIQKLLNEYTLVLSSYTEVFHIKESLKELSYFMNEYRSKLISLDKSYISLFEGLFVNLQNWYDALFVTGTDSIEAYKDSIMADVKIIKMMTINVEENRSIEFF